MYLTPYEFQNAKEGSLFIKKGDKLVSISKNELFAEFNSEFKKVGDLEFKYNVMAKSLGKFEKLAKRHFIAVFTLFKLKALNGEIDIEEELLDLDTKVLNDKLTVASALKKHEFLKTTFDALYGEEYDNLKKLGGK